MRILIFGRHVPGIIQASAVREGHTQGSETWARKRLAGRRIDALVYALYGLRDDEIRIVEEATQR